MSPLYVAGCAVVTHPDIMAKFTSKFNKKPATRIMLTDAMLSKLPLNQKPKDLLLSHKTYEPGEGTSTIESRGVVIGKVLSIRYSKNNGLYFIGKLYKNFLSYMQNRIYDRVKKRGRQNSDFTISTLLNKLACMCSMSSRELPTSGKNDPDYAPNATSCSEDKEQVLQDEKFIDHIALTNTNWRWGTCVDYITGFKQIYPFLKSLHIDENTYNEMAQEVKQRESEMDQQQAPNIDFEKLLAQYVIFSNDKREVSDYLAFQRECFGLDTDFINAESDSLSFLNEVKEEKDIKGTVTEPPDTMASGGQEQTHLHNCCNHNKQYQQNSNMDFIKLYMNEQFSDMKRELLKSQLANASQQHIASQDSKHSRQSRHSRDSRSRSRSPLAREERWHRSPPSYRRRSRSPVYRDDPYRDYYRNRHFTRFRYDDKPEQLMSEREWTDRFIQQSKDRDSDRRYEPVNPFLDSHKNATRNLNGLESGFGGNGGNAVGDTGLNQSAIQTIIAKALQEGLQKKEPPSPPPATETSTSLIKIESLFKEMTDANKKTVDLLESLKKQPVASPPSSTDSPKPTGGEESSVVKQPPDPQAQEKQQQIQQEQHKNVDCEQPVPPAVPYNNPFDNFVVSRKRNT